MPKSPSHKVCALCGERKAITEFRSKRSKCKQCDKQVREKLKSYIDELKNQPCTDCGQTYPSYVMDFDHLDGYTKHKNVADLIGERTSIRVIRNELAKCELVCANCHRIRTHTRRNKLDRPSLHG